MLDIKKKVHIEYPVFHPEVQIGHTFKFYDMCRIGLGEKRKDFFDLTSLVSPALRQKAWSQLAENESLVPNRNLTPVGIVPESLSQFTCLDKIMTQMTVDDYKKLDMKNVRGLNDIKGLVHDFYSVPRGWDYAIHLRNYSAYEYRGKQSSWLPYAEKFLSETIALVQSLPFKEIGYCMILKFNKRYGTTPHRDSYFKNNNIHLLNIVLNKNSVPFYTYDSLKKNKSYTPSWAFTFNELDLHGSDPEPETTYMLRVDGIYEDWLCRELGLVDGYANHEKYLKHSELENIKIYD
jgi:hypothetical protein